MLSVDSKSSKILRELDLNSRQSYNLIAKKVKLSKDSVKYRISKLEKEGIIDYYQTLIDVGKLGYISFSLFLKFQGLTPSKEKEIIEYLKNQSEVCWLVSIDGRYDLGMSIIVKNISIMNDFWKKLFKNYLNYISDNKLTIYTKVVTFPYNYLFKSHSSRQYIFITEPQLVTLDELDLGLLNILTYNARMPTIEIARKLNVTPKTITSRMRKLEKEKVIVGYRTVLNINKLGYQHFKLVMNLHNVTLDKLDKLKSYIYQHPNFIFDNEVLGGNIIEAELEAKNLIELRSIIDDINQNFSDIIKDYEYLTYYKQHKYIINPLSQLVKK